MEHHDIFDVSTNAAPPPTVTEQLAEAELRLPGFERRVRLLFADLRRMSKVSRVKRGEVELLMKKHNVFVGNDSSVETMLSTEEAFVQTMVRKERELWRMFREADSNKNGELDVFELYAFSYNLGQPISFEEAKSMMRHADKTPTDTIT